VLCSGVYGRPGGNNITNSFIHESLSLLVALNPDRAGGGMMVILSKGKILKVSAA